MIEFLKSIWANAKLRGALLVIASILVGSIIINTATNVDDEFCSKFEWCAETLDSAVKL